ncbi:MAG: radical SAM family heme chaperone HemW, partial [Pseudomonadota bacterium]
MSDDWRNGGFGVYIHWPFCESKCPYCDFNSFVSPKVDHDRWLSSYLSEIERYARLLPGRVLNSVFFGGGTPSLMPADVVSAIIETLRAHWPAANDLEITLEANPTSVEATRFQGFSSAGVNRVSMGVQALNDADLRRLGRTHTTKEALQAFDIAKQIFDRVSFDLIYARQDQSLEDWCAELRRALELSVDHLSLYQLTIEPGTPFGTRHAQGRLRGLPGGDDAADMYDATQEICTAAGYATYEVSNHARPGAESRHNLIYWNYGDFVGIGPGAHGRITVGARRYATETYSHPDRWLSAVRDGSGERERNVISGPEQADEYLMMGLRLRDGIDLNRYEALAQSSLGQSA